MTTFDTATAFGRLRILWDATADPQLAMSDDEVADVETVLQEHAAMAAKLELARAERDDTQRRFDALVTSDKAKQGAADWMLGRLHDDRLIDDETYRSLCGLLRDQIDATRFLTHSEDWGPLTDRFRSAVKRAKDAEAEQGRLAARVAELEQLRTARKADDRHIDRVLAMLVLREGGRVEFTAAEMHDAPAHGEFVCFENLLTRGMALAFQASDVDMSKPDDELVIGAGSPETSALSHCPTCGAPEWHEDGRRGWNPIDVECENCAGTYAKEQADGESND